MEELKIHLCHLSTSGLSLRRRDGRRQWGRQRRGERQERLLRLSGEAEIRSGGPSRYSVYIEAFLLISRNVLEIRQKSRDRSSLQPELSKFESNHIVGNGWKTQCNESVQCIYKDLHQFSQVQLDLVFEMADHGVLEDVQQFCVAQNSCSS